MKINSEIILSLTIFFSLLKKLDLEMLQIVVLYIIQEIKNVLYIDLIQKFV